MSAASLYGAAVGPQDDLDLRRSAMLKDAGNTQRLVPLSAFFDYVLPHLPKAFRDHNVVERVLDSLKQGDKPTYTGEDWGDIVKSRARGTKERDIYAGVDVIVAAIQKAVEQLQLPYSIEPVTTYVDAPGKAPVSTTRTASHIPDGCFVLRIKHEPGDEDHWIDIAVVAEFKRKESGVDVNNNSKQVLWDMHHITREDSRRRFTYGFTIEKKQMRLWRIDRSDICISECFDMVTEPGRVVHFFLVCLYSPMHRLEWDTSMQYVRGADSEDGTPHLLITVNSHNDKSPRVYKTLGLLSNVGTEAIRGQGTRVWRVQGQKIGDTSGPQQTMVLKDSWIDSDREREGKVVAEIRSAGEKLSPEQNKVLQEALLTTEVHGDVWIQPDGDDPDDTEPYPDETFRPNIRSLIHPDDANQFELQKPAIMDMKAARSSQLQSQVAGNSESVFRQQENGENPPTYAPKTHTRIVFLEDCRPIHEERSITRALGTMSKACDAIRAIHQAGWVHRDISSGNILTWGDEVKISDFEYAKQFLGMQTAEKLQKIPGHNVRTGTRGFISVEVYEQKFLFRPLQLTYISDPTPIAEDSGASSSTPNAYSAGKIPWQYHPLNDAESLLWLLRDFTFNRDFFLSRKPYPDEEVKCPEVGELPKSRVDRIQGQDRAARALPYGASERTCYITLQDNEQARQELRSLHPIVQKGNSMGWALRELRSHLAAAYAQAEQDPSTITNTSSGPFLATARDTISQAKRSLEMRNHVVCIRPLEPEIVKIKKTMTGKPAASHRPIQKPSETDLKCKRKRAPTPELEQSSSGEASDSPSEAAALRRSTRNVARPSGSGHKNLRDRRPTRETGADTARARKPNKKKRA